MKKTLVTIIALTLAFAVGCAKQSPVDKARAAMGKMSAGFQDAAEKLKAAKDDKEAAAVITALAENMGKVAEEMKQLEKQYPELKDIEKNPAFQPEMKKFEDAFKGYIDASIAVYTKYPDSKEFNDASAKLQKVFEK